METEFKFPDFDAEPEWRLVVIKGEQRLERPWCDCKHKGFGYTKRSDGAWVRPCCMRREKAAWERHGDRPVPVPSSEATERSLG